MKYKWKNSAYINANKTMMYKNIYVMMCVHNMWIAKKKYFVAIFLPTQSAKWREWTKPKKINLAFIIPNGGRETRGNKEDTEPRGAQDAKPIFFSSHTHAGFPAMRERWTGAWSELTSRRVGRSGASPSGEEAACEGALCWRNPDCQLLAAQTRN